KRPAVRRLLERIAEGSPFLWQLATGDPARLLRLFDCRPEAHFADLLHHAAAAIASATEEADAMRRLRHVKAETALLIALADLGEVWSLPRVTQALTDIADAAIGAALRFLLRRASSDGRLKIADSAQPEHGSGYFVLAMGK